MDRQSLECDSGPYIGRKIRMCPQNNSLPVLPSSFSERITQLDEQLSALEGELYWMEQCLWRLRSALVDLEHYSWTLNNQM